MPADFLSFLFTEKDLKGDMQAYGMDTQNVYQKISVNDIYNATGTLVYQSAWLWPPKTSEGTVSKGCTIAFNGLPCYSGDFIQTTLKETDPSPVIVKEFWPDHGGISFLLVKTPIEDKKNVVQAFSFKGMFSERWNERLSAMGDVDGAHVKQSKDATFTWECFPKSTAGLSSERIYLKILQDLDIELDCWPDYKASITYWIELYINDTNQKIEGYVAKIDSWVEDGHYHDEISAGIRDALIGGMDAMNDALRTELENQLTSNLSAYGVTQYNIARLYYLPGNQVPASVLSEFPQPGTVTGSTLDDVTIVIELTDILLGTNPWPQFEGAVISGGDKSLTGWMEKNRETFKNTNGGKMILDYYGRLKKQGAFGMVLKDRALLQAARNMAAGTSKIMKNGGELTGEVLGHFETFFGGLDKMTAEQDRTTLDRLKNFVRMQKGKKFTEIEKDLAAFLKG